METVWSSPLQALTHFHIFLHIKSFHGGKNSNYDDAAKEAVNIWLQSQAAFFYDEGIQNLILRYDKCLIKVSTMLKYSSILLTVPIIYYYYFLNTYYTYFFLTNGTHYLYIPCKIIRIHLNILIYQIYRLLNSYIKKLRLFTHFLIFKFLNFYKINLWSLLRHSFTLYFQA